MPSHKHGSSKARPAGKTPGEPTHDDGILAAIAIREALKEVGVDLQTKAGGFINYTALATILRDAFGRGVRQSNNPAFTFHDRAGEFMELGAGPLLELNGKTTRIPHLDPSMADPEVTFTVEEVKAGLVSVDIEVHEPTRRKGTVSRIINARIVHSPGLFQLAQLFRDYGVQSSALNFADREVVNDVGTVLTAPDGYALTLPVLSGPALLFAFLIEAYLDEDDWRNRKTQEWNFRFLHAIQLLLWGEKMVPGIIPSFTSTEIAAFIQRVKPEQAKLLAGWAQRLVQSNRDGKVAEEYALWWEKENRRVSDKSFVAIQKAFTWVLRRLAEVLEPGLSRHPSPRPPTEPEPELDSSSESDSPPPSPPPSRLRQRSRPASRPAHPGHSEDFGPPPTRHTFPTRTPSRRQRSDSRPAESAEFSRPRLAQTFPVYDDRTGPGGETIYATRPRPSVYVETQEVRPSFREPQSASSFRPQSRRMSMGGRGAPAYGEPIDPIEAMRRPFELQRLADERAADEQYQARLAARLTPRQQYGGTYHSGVAPPPTQYDQRAPPPPMQYVPPPPPPPQYVQVPLLGTVPVVRQRRRASIYR